MKSIEVKQYKDDPQSLYSYLGQAGIKAVTFQHTEDPKLKLLDIAFEIRLDSKLPAEFLIRIETPMSEINALLEKLTQAIKNPKPHPYDEDLFDRAVTGKTLRKRNEELVKKYLK